MPFFMFFMVLDLVSLTDEIKQGNHGEIHRIIIWHRHQIIYNKAFKGDPQIEERVGSGEGPHMMQSVSKSILSLAFGIAEKKGFINHNTPVSKFFPTEDPLKQTMTMHDLLTMQSGLEWHQGTGDPQNQDHRLLLQEEDWVAYIWSKPMKEKPGKSLIYSDGNAVLVGASIAKAVGQPVDQFIQTELFDPLGIKDTTWLLRDQTGLVHTGATLSMKAEDLLKIGQLVLQRGTWQGKEIISNQFLDKALRHHTTSKKGNKYGYFWWFHEKENRLLPLALGRGEQSLLIDPENELVIAMTGWISQPEHFKKVVTIYRELTLD